MKTARYIAAEVLVMFLFVSLGFAAPKTKTPATTTTSGAVKGTTTAPKENPNDKLEVSPTDKIKLINDINVLQDNFKDATTSPVQDLGPFQQFTPMREELLHHQRVWENVVQDNTKALLELNNAKDSINNSDVKGLDSHLHKAFEIRQTAIAHFDEIKNSEIRLLNQHIKAATLVKDVTDKLKDSIPAVGNILNQGPAKAATYVYDYLVKDMKNDLGKIKASHSKLKLPTYRTVVTLTPKV
jgi:hypothetical protein